MYEEGTKQHSIDADGLMITGPGEPKRFEGQPSHHARIFDGRNFWTNIDKFKKLKREDSVGVLGAGETAAAIVVKLSQILTKDITIEIIHRHGAVFSRGESFDENRWFTDPTDWKTLSEEQRDELIERTDRGVFSVHSKRIIDQARNVNPMVMQVSKISFKHGLPLVIGKGGWERSYEYLVVANGFDPLWFVKFMDEPLMKLCPGEDNLRRRIRTDLSVDHISPRIHLPMLAAFEQGPGFPNLSCLGLLADRVLETYVRPKKARRR
jgi:mycobactin lysine-N-oxygenase